MNLIRTASACASIVLVALLGLACSDHLNPITTDPASPESRQLGFASSLVARLDPSTGEIWLGAPPSTAAPDTLVTVTVPGSQPVTIRALHDGSFLYRYVGDVDSPVTARWLSPANVWTEREIHPDNAGDHLQQNLAAAGLYPNRLTVRGNKVWIVSSGDNALVPYDLESLEPSGDPVQLPESSNPWDAAFFSDEKGIITTLFQGVFTFDTSSGSVSPVDTAGFREFASPNGCAVLGNSAWVANPNPIGYFPSSFGQGWISEVNLDGNPSVTSEIDVPWFNPQNVITDGNYVYVSCNGVVDFVPPDFHAVSLSNGGIVVINPVEHRIVATYALGKCGPSSMALSPDQRFLFIGSSVTEHLFRIDLVNHRILNGIANPIVLGDMAGSYVPFVKINPQGLLVAAGFNSDTLYFVDSFTGETDPFPFFNPIGFHPDAGALLGVQDAAFCVRDGQKGLLILTTVESAMHWLPM